MEKPTMQQRLESLGNFIWDSENGKVLGRGGRSWAEIGAFYLVYYACLASFFAATLAVFYETIADKEPKLLKDSSLLDGNPGMGFRPRIDLTEPKLKAYPSNEKKNAPYKKDLTEFLKPYEKTQTATDCSQYSTTRQKGSKLPCEVKYSDLVQNCPTDDDYGFRSGEPCVLIKMNKVYGWEPKLWEDESDADFIKPEWNMNYQKHIIPMRCYAKDSENNQRLGNITYHPQQGFPVYYYPFENQDNYLSPLVFVKFSGIEKDKTHEIECRAYAKNIDYDRTDMQGSVQFKLYVAE